MCCTVCHGLPKAPDIVNGLLQFLWTTLGTCSFFFIWILHLTQCVSQFCMLVLDPYIRQASFMFRWTRFVTFAIFGMPPETLVNYGYGNVFLTIFSHLLQVGSRLAICFRWFWWLLFSRQFRWAFVQAGTHGLSWEAWMPFPSEIW